MVAVSPYRSDFQDMAKVLKQMFWGVPERIHQRYSKNTLWVILGGPRLDTQKILEKKYVFYSRRTIRGHVNSTFVCVFLGSRSQSDANLARSIWQSGKVLNLAQSGNLERIPIWTIWKTAEEHGCNVRSNLAAGPVWRPVCKRPKGGTHLEEFAWPSES